MKTLTTLVLTMLISTLCLAQNGINYKAIIKDANGNVVASQPVAVQFAILQGVAQTNVYQEIHYPTTDANGLVIINIGEGTLIYGAYNTIDWASDTHFLNTQISTGGPLVNMGTTEFKTVPYAINAETASYALNAETASNVTGLESLDEGNGIGWRIKGRNPNNYDNIGGNAVDLSSSSLASSVYGASGNSSTALGIKTTASGNYSTTMGSSTTASGENSTAMGNYTTASGEYSTAMGSRTTASGKYSTTMGYITVASGFGSTAMGGYTTALGSYSTAMGGNTVATGHNSTSMGYTTTASSYASLAIGRYNVGGGNADSWVGTDPIFEIGIGTDATTQANAMTVRKDGNVGIGTTSPQSTLHVVGDLRIGSQETITDGGSFRLDFYATLRPSLNGAQALGDSEKRWSAVYATNGVINTSDRRDKENINDLSYGLNEVMQLRPVSYTWKDKRLSNGKPKLGLIAQEVRAIINEVVQDKEWIQEEGSTEKRQVEAERMGIYYSDLIPVLVKAIQEQQELIEMQQKQIDELKTLDTRVKQLETLLKTANQ